LRQEVAIHFDLRTALTVEAGGGDPFRSQGLMRSSYGRGRDGGERPDHLLDSHHSPCQCRQFEKPPPAYFQMIRIHSFISENIFLIYGLSSEHLKSGLSINILKISLE